MNETDFCFGGSFLGLLATISDGSTRGLTSYRASRLPGTKCIIVMNRKSYKKDLSESGFQLERLLTGKELEDTTSTETVEHMHIMKINDMCVLFIAEIDAFNESNNNLVEIKSTFVPKARQSVLLFFQMLSNGSSVLFHMDHTRKIQSMLLSEVANRILPYANHQSLEKNIINRMSQILEFFQGVDDGEYLISIENDGINLREAQDHSIFPPRDVTLRLISPSPQELPSPSSPSSPTNPIVEDSINDNFKENTNDKLISKSSPSARTSVQNYSDISLESLCAYNDDELKDTIRIDDSRIRLTYYSIQMSYCCYFTSGCSSHMHREEKVDR